MLKYLFVFVILFSQNNIIYTQIPDTVGNKNELFNLSFSAGPVFPFGDISSKEVNNSSGYAHIGYGMSFDIGFNLIGPLNYGVKGIFSTLGVNPDNLANYLKTIYNDDFSYTDNSQNWKIFGFLTGISSTLKVKKKFLLEYSLYAGFLNIPSHTTEVYLDSFYGMTGTTIRFNDDRVFSPLFNAGIGAFYKISEKFWAGLSFEYYYSNPKIDSKKSVTSLGNTTESGLTFYRTIHLLNSALIVKYIL
ncbi:MAG: hypothetical protein ACHQJ4_00930 [Ignavibacteria bacterium]